MIDKVQQAGDLSNRGPCKVISFCKQHLRTGLLVFKLVNALTLDAITESGSCGQLSGMRTRLQARNHKWKSGEGLVISREVKFED